MLPGGLGIQGSIWEAGGRVPKGRVYPTPPLEWRLFHQSVRILLECFLDSHCFDLEQSMKPV